MKSDGLVDHIIWQLQNEGLATCVAYKARPLFPSPHEDYAVLENPVEVRRLVQIASDQLSETKTKPPSEVKDSMIEAGISNRAFYIAGAHMAQMIEEKLGKEALVETVIDGPNYFLDAYSSLVEDAF